MSLDPTKLREKLEMILDFMAENKLISKESADKMKNEKEGGFLDNLVNGLSNSGMEEKDIRDEHFQKKLMGTMVTHSLGMNEATQLGMDAMNNALKLKADEPANTLEKTLGNPEANKKLDKLQGVGILLSNKLNADGLRNDSLTPNPKPDFNAIAKQMLAKPKNDLEKKFENNEKEKKEFQELAKEMEKQLAESLRNAYGGDDPRIAGEVQVPIIGPIMTVMADWIEPEANPTSVAARVMEATENLPGNDYLGIKDKSPTAEIIKNILSPTVDMVDAEFKRPKLEH